MKERISEDGSLAYGKKTNGVFKIPSRKSDLKTIKESKKSSIKDEDVSYSSDEIAYWGDGNDFPQLVYKDIKENTILGSALDFKARAMCSEFMYGKVEYDELGKEKFTPVVDPTVQEWIKKTRMLTTYLFPACQDFSHFSAVFPEIVLSQDRKSIVNISRQKAAHCRFSTQDEKGNIPFTYITPNWDKRPSLKEVIKIDNVQVDFDPIGYVQFTKAKRYIYPVLYPSIDETYYPLSVWNAIRESKWLDVAKTIPAYKKAYFENSSTLRYHVEIADWWWEKRYEGFFQKDPAERIKLITEVIDDFEDRMTGVEKAFKSVVSMMKVIEGDKEYSGWKITPIKGEKMDSGDLETSQEASQHIMFALGLHPSIMGSTPGGKLNSSGSEQRIALNNFYITHRVHQEMILDPLQFVFDFNGWDYTVRFKNPLIHTLDAGNEISKSNEKL